MKGGGLIIHEPCSHSGPDESIIHLACVFVTMATGDRCPRNLQGSGAHDERRHQKHREGGRKGVGGLLGAKFVNSSEFSPGWLEKYWWVK